VASHSAPGFSWVIRQERLNNRQMLARFFDQAVIVVAGLVPFPGNVTERAEEDL
jgi:hypothetical protein